jgi:3-deoxy-7-phosphoheptulonate synthase
VLITLSEHSEAPRIQSWLIREGVASRLLDGGRLLLVDDPFIPHHLLRRVDADPAVLRREDTHDLPRRVLRSGIEEAEWPFPGRIPTLIAGPCSIDSFAVADETAHLLSSLQLGWMRGGTHKARTSPYAFQGHGFRAAEWLREACDRHGLRAVSEVLDTPDMEAIAELLDLVQVGARQMHSFRFLQRVGALEKPVLLKRGLSATPEEWLWAAEYLLDAGAPSVVFCERGIRTPAPLKRFTLDLQAIPFIREMTPYPIFVDPSHAAGTTPYVAPLSLAALAAGAHGLLIECHPDPAKACSDALQALDFDALTDLARRAQCLGKLEVTP